MPTAVLACCYSGAATAAAFSGSAPTQVAGATVLAYVLARAARRSAAQVRRVRLLAVAPSQTTALR